MTRNFLQHARRSPINGHNIILSRRIKVRRSKKHDFVASAPPVRRGSVAKKTAVRLGVLLAALPALFVFAASPAGAVVDIDELVDECASRTSETLYLERIGYNTTMCRGDVAFSANGYYGLVMQFDGNLVLYRLSQPFWEGSAVAVIWVSQTAGNPGAIDTGYAAHMDYNGRFAVYSITGFEFGRTVSNTEGWGYSWIKVQDDGKLVQYSFNNQPIAQTCGGTWCDI